MLYFPRWQILLIVFLCFAAPYVLLSNFIDKTDLRDYAFLPQKQINLGLDLRGGAHLVYEAELENYYLEQMNALKADVRRALRPRRKENEEKKRKIGYRGLRADIYKVSLTVPKEADLADAEERLKGLTSQIGGGFAGGALSYDYKLTRDAHKFTLTMTDAYKDVLADKVIEQTIEVMRRRIDAFGTREPNILRQGYERIILQVPGEDDVARLKNEVGKTAKMTFQMVNMDASLADKPPAGFVKVPSADDPNLSYVLDEEVLLSGDNLVNASSIRDEYGRPTVSFTFDRKGSSVFARVTSDNVGQLFAIVLDNKVISAPRIQTAILGGSGVITGDFTQQEAANLALLLRAGALPIDLKIVEERTVGPELGAESVVAGRDALIYGFVVVTLFMIAYYGV
ncbi:MAG: protein translocase subunit SecD, partial [Pseudomonadota bacterium]